MWIAEFTDYKVFLKAKIKTYPNQGRGQSSRLAKHLRISPMALSHIMTRDRHFTLEQAIKVAGHFGLDDKSKEDFVNLVCFARADSAELKAFYQEKLTAFRLEAQNIKNHVPGKSELSEPDKGIFYSNWYYSGIRLLSSIPGFQTVDAIADYFGLSRPMVGEIAAFLVNTGLCAEEGGKVRMATKSTHVDDKSKFVNNHRRNWRVKALEKFTEPGPDDLFWSSPVSLSKTDAAQFRKELLNLINSFSMRVKDSPEQKLMCVNIDWFEF